MEKALLLNVIEALIFASDTCLSVNQMSAILQDVDKKDIESAIDELMGRYKDRSFFLKKVSGGYQFATKPQYSKWIKKMLVGRAQSRLTRAALETLAIIAFSQPITRVEVSHIRGVNSDGVIKTLLERRLVAITGRDSGPGRALLFSTTREFLLYFGINDMNDLPKPKEIEELLAEGEGARILEEIPEEELVDVEESGGAEESSGEGNNDQGVEPSPDRRLTGIPPVQTDAGDVTPEEPSTDTSDDGDNLAQDTKVAGDAY